MSHAIFLDITVPLDRFTLSVTWETGRTCLGIFGHSGAGKTTLLEAVAGLRKEARGIIRVDGRTWIDSSRGIRLPPERRGVGYVPQDSLLFPHLDVLGNLLAGLRRASRRSGRGTINTEKVFEVLELGDLRRARIAALSGGERQRVALGRALCSAPDLLLLDEPLAGLDAPLRRRILPYLLRVAEEFAIPTIHVSHDASEIRMLCQEVLVLVSGRAVARGRPDEVLTRPEILPVAWADGFENLLLGRVAGLGDGAATIEPEPGLILTVPAEGLAVGQTATIGVRAADLILSLRPPSGLSAQNVLPGSIRAIHDTIEEGGRVIVMVDVGRQPFRMVVAVTRQACQQLSLRPGTSVFLIAKAQACRVLAAR
jgi:molybdate transport system ATP-binding protein